MSARITQQELESYLWGAAVLLRGLIDAGDYKQFIFPLLFFKRISDVWDEEYQAALADSDGDLSYAEFAENHRFQIPEGAHWSEVRQTPKNVGHGHPVGPPAIGVGQPRSTRRHLRRCAVDQPRAPARRNPQEPDRAFLDANALGGQRPRGRARQRLRIPDQEVRRRFRPHGGRVLHQPHASCT